MKLFGTSGVRGTLEKRLKPDFVTRLGLAIGNFFGGGSEVIVASDHRYSSKPVRMAVISGLLAAGVDVIDIGIFPTPGALHFLKNYGADGAVIITGSHTPPEITGVLVFKEDTSELSKEEEAEVERIFRERPTVASWDSVGDYVVIPFDEALEVYTSSVLSLIDEYKVEGRKVVFDAGCGTMAGVADKILDIAGVRVITLNNISDPEFSCRSPCPTPENLKEMGAVARAVSADLSVGTDGDGDRAIFGDEKGTVYWGDVSGTIFVRELAEKGVKKFVVTINTSSVALMVAEEKGAEVFFSCVGPPSIAHVMKDKEAEFGFEESGKFIWSDAIYYGDAILATLRMLELLEDEGKSFAELASELPRSIMKKEAFKCPDEIKQEVLRVACELVEAKIPKDEVREIIDVDGRKVLLKDYSWILLRPSGTEPVFRMFVEAFTRERFEELYKIGKEAVEEALRRAGAKQ